jgi:hypothetical protein
MFTFEYTPGLSKEKILSLVSQQEIIEAFLGRKINFTDAILSPFRDEKSPSFTFKRIGDKVIFRDWGSGLYGDAFTLVQKLHGSCSFNEALYLINQKLNLRLTDVAIDIDRNTSTVTKESHTKRSFKAISIDQQIYTLTDYKYWKQFGIPLSLLQQYKVVSCRHAWCNGVLIATYTSLNPVYAYVFKDQDVLRYKIYRPFAEKKYKWFCNITPNCIEGYDNLDWHGDLVILTKSMKDVMCLRVLGYNAFSLHGESNQYPKDLHEKMLKRFDRVIIFYDNDSAGIYNSKRIASEYSLKQIQIPLNFKVKDISDFVSQYGIEKAKDLMSQLTTYEEN